MMIAFLQTARAADDKAAMVGQIFRDQELLPSIAPESPQAQQVLDGLATSYARLEVGPHNDKWFQDDPKFQALSARIRADLKTELPSILAASNAAAPHIRQRIRESIAGAMSLDDLNAILAYYQTAEGKRYQAFIAKVDAVMATGAVGMMQGTPAKQNAPEISEEKIKHYIRPMMLSHTYQAVTALATMGADPSGLGAIGFYMGAAIMQNLATVEAIDRDYADQLPAFEDFTKTEAMQHLARALAAIMKSKDASLMGPILKAVNDAAAKHMADWKAFADAQ